MTVAEDILKVYQGGSIDESETKLNKGLDDGSGWSDAFNNLHCPGSNGWGVAVFPDGSTLECRYDYEGIHSNGDEPELREMRLPSAPHNLINIQIDLSERLIYSIIERVFEDNGEELPRSSRGVKFSDLVAVAPGVHEAVRNMIENRLAEDAIGADSIAAVSVVFDDIDSIDRENIIKHDWTVK